MPQIPERSARLAQLIFKNTSPEALSLIRVKMFSDPQNNDGVGIRALNLLLGERQLTINQEGQIDVNPQKPNQLPKNSG